MDRHMNIVLWSSANPSSLADILASTRWVMPEGPPHVIFWSHTLGRPGQARSD